MAGTAAVPKRRPPCCLMAEWWLFYKYLSRHRLERSASSNQSLWDIIISGCFIDVCCYLWWMCLRRQFAEFHSWNGCCGAYTFWIKIASSTRGRALKFYNKLWSITHTESKIDALFSLFGKWRNVKFIKVHICWGDYLSVVKILTAFCSSLIESDFHQIWMCKCIWFLA